MRIAALGLVLVLATSGCYRTHYVNFLPEHVEMRTSHVPVKASAWRHFFLWGWLPGEKRIDARELCGSSENIHSIDTRRKFIQGLIAAFAGYYVNIYSPWDGAVYCIEQAELD